MTSYNVGFSRGFLLNCSSYVNLFRLTTLSFGTGAAGFISKTEPFKHAERAVFRLNTTWNSVSSELIAHIAGFVVWFLYMF